MIDIIYSIRVLMIRTVLFAIVFNNSVNTISTINNLWCFILSYVHFLLNFQCMNFLSPV